MDLKYKRFKILYFLCKNLKQILTYLKIHLKTQNCLVWPGFEPRTSCVLVGHSTTEVSKLKTNLAEILSLYRKWENFPLPFPPFPRREFGNFSCVVNTYTKLHVQAKKSPFWIFNGYMMDRFVSYSMLKVCEKKTNFL